MVARFIYRLFSLFFFVLALACWLIMGTAVYLQLFVVEAFSLSTFSTGILSVPLALWSHILSNEAWRKGRYHRYYDHPLWRD
jgi:hypothetical protein